MFPIGWNFKLVWRIACMRFEILASQRLANVETHERHCWRWVRTAVSRSAAVRSGIF